MTFNLEAVGTFLAVWVAGALVVNGLMQGLKKIITKAPSWFWWLLTLLASLGSGVAYSMNQWVWYGLGIYAISQLFWDKIFKKVDTALDSAGG